MPQVTRCISALLCAAVTSLEGQVLLDDFNRPNSNTVGAPWAEVESFLGVTSINGNQLAVGGFILSGREYVWTNASALYGTTLHSNSCELRWAFNMQQLLPDPSGFNGGSSGFAFVLAGSSSDLTVGQGYAVVLGQSGSIDALRLVRYNNGLDANANLTNLISYGDYGTQALSVLVTYAPATNFWQMFVTSSSAQPFTNPLLASTLAGSVVNATYTSVALPYVALLCNHGVIGGGFFDNIYLPDPCSTLPIELLSFDAVAQPDAVHLSWTTASETNNDHFTVERSSDLTEFEPIGQVAGAGHSLTAIEYSLEDPDPLEGISYYRLRQTDLDGADRIVGLVAVDRPAHGSPFHVVAGPDGVLTITGPAGPATWSLIDSQGRILASGHANGSFVVPSSATFLLNGVGGLLLEGAGARSLTRLMITAGEPVLVEAP